MSPTEQGLSGAVHAAHHPTSSVNDTLKEQGVSGFMLDQGRSCMVGGLGGGGGLFSDLV